DTIILGCIRCSHQCAPQIASVQGKWLWQGGTDAWQLAIGFSVSSLLNSSTNTSCSFPLSCTGRAPIISQHSSSVLRFSSATNPRAFKASFTSGFSSCCRSHPEPIDGVLAISTQSTIECRPLISLSAENPLAAFPWLCLNAPGSSPGSC